METALETCVCGRAFSHCKHANCASKNVYVKKARSFEESARLGRMVTVFGCRRCMKETTSEMECKAPSREFTPEFQAYRKPVDAPVWGNLKPGTEKYLEALNAHAVELTEKKGMTLIKAYVECVRKGWSLKGIEVEEDIQKALNEAGLGCPTEGNAQDQSVVGHGGDLGAKEASLPIQEPVSLDDIIRTMQEEQK